jgi:hypothetical protein
MEITQEETPSIQKRKGCDRKGHIEENCWKLHPKKLLYYVVIDIKGLMSKG